MWRRDFKHQVELAEPPGLESLPKGDDFSEDGDEAFCLTKAETAQLKEADQALQRDLAFGVRHIDPAEYSEERIAGLLAQANQNAEPRLMKRKSRFWA